jgi:hypothetical protein
VLLISSATRIGSESRWNRRWAPAVISGSPLCVPIRRPREWAASVRTLPASCARPATAYPFGCVLRGRIPEAVRPRFVPYPLPDAPGVVLQRLAAQPPDAPFIAVFERDDCEAAWPARRAAPDYLVHPNGASRIVRAVLSCPAPPPIDGFADVQFAIGPPRLDLDLDGIGRCFLP